MQQQPGGNSSLKREGRTTEILQKEGQIPPRVLFQVCHTQEDLALASVPSKIKAALQIQLQHWLSLHSGVS